MIRNIDINELKNAKFYEANDMARLDAGECSGCHACCCGTGDTLNLDPYDVYRLETGLSKDFKTLLAEHLELRVADGIIMPFLKMDKELTIGDVTENDACTFLNDEGRCNIHASRPAICRLFPLGRVYEEGSHKYWLMENECHKENRTKIKIKKWLDTPDFAKYEAYIDDWHAFTSGITRQAASLPEDQLKALNMAILQYFYFLDYDTNKDFYSQFYERLKSLKSN
ncbi:MAG: YkgJ family cysteine cluster protein [Lachnospiraceae bacterium]|nr:YkgJ family cysteine cluster protein [Lachnospiraceae bacterium]